MIDGLLEALALKDVLRTGWVREGVAQPESVAAHSWGMALLVLVLLPADLDRERALTYALLHDLAEAWVGDHPPQDGVTDKRAREQAAMEDLCHRLGRPDLLAHWLAYEDQVDAEARFVRQLDGLDMALQARRYASQGLDPLPFLASARRKLVDAPLLAVHDALDLEPVRAVRFIDRQQERLQLAVALGQHRFGGRIRFHADLQPPTERVRSALQELGVTVAVPEPDQPVDRVVDLENGPWELPPLEPGVTGIRIVRDALVRRIERLLPEG